MDSVTAFFVRQDRGEVDPKPLPRWMRRKMEKRRKGGCGCHFMPASTKEEDPYRRLLFMQNERRLPFPLRFRPGRKA